MAGISPRELKNRIRSMESTRQITRAMEMVAASRLHQARNRLNASRPYFEALSDTVSQIAGQARGLPSPYLRRREGNRAAFVVIAGDRGLAGGYNSNVLKRAYAAMAGRKPAVMPIGRKAADHFRARGIPLLTDEFSEAAELDVSGCFHIADLLNRAWLGGEYDEIHMVYTEFQSVLSQTTAARQLLPLQPGDADSPAIFEPDADSVFAALIQEYLGGMVYGALCDSRCAEHAARRTAMDSATSNADELIGGLRQKYNQARQSGITRELTEIVAGASAENDSKKRS